MKTPPKGENTTRKSFAETYPELIKDWSDKNDCSPYDVSPRSSKKVWWRCSKQGHPDYQERISHHADGHNGCLICRGRKPELGQDLATLFPELALEWDYEKNKYPPEEYVIGSAYKAHWVCSKHPDHKWRAEIRTRTGKDHTGCPICSNHKLLTGYNDLATRTPHIAAEWDYEKNKDTPQDVIYTSTAKRYWKCKYGHKWKTSIRNRVVNGTNCPDCNKQATSFMEQFIYLTCVELYGKDNVLHRDNQTIGMELDVVVPSKQIAFEPGAWYWHQTKIENDIEKQQRCKENGFRCYTIYDGCDDSNIIALENIITIPGYTTSTDYSSLAVLLASILDIQAPEFPWSDIAANALSRSLAACDYENSVGFLYPHLIAEWHEENIYSPFEVSYASNIMIKWRCSKNPDHIFEAKPNERTGKRAYGCPYCSGRRVDVGRNDLASQYPEIAKEYSSKNELKADEVSIGSHREVLWVCPVEDHPDYYQNVRNHIRGYGCPRCRKSGKRVFSGEDDLCTTHPALAKSYCQSNPKKPEAVRATFQDVVRWHCEKCEHDFEQAVDIVVKHFEEKGRCLCQRCYADYPDKQTLKEALRQGEALNKIARRLHHAEPLLKRLCDEYHIPWKQREIKQYTDNEWDAL